MIDATGLTKKFGDKVAVDNLSFSVRSGMVTGFLGPNGAGKSTTMRLILGLDHPTSGHSRVNGQSYKYTKAPMTEVGALLESKSVHPGRTARSHLRALAATHGISKKRVDEVIELVGLSAVANKRAGSYSLGMSQRLGLAGALLGDPETLILDEPINGLDPEGVAWVRSLVKYLASEGRTVFISSHLMTEMALTADHVIIIGQGHLIIDAPMNDLINRASGRVTRVRSPNLSEIVDVVTRSGRTVTDTDDGAVIISGLTAEAVGKEATRRGWILYELTPVQRSLEDIYMELTDSAQEFHAGAYREGLIAGDGGFHPLVEENTVPKAAALEEPEVDGFPGEEPESPIRVVPPRSVPVVPRVPDPDSVYAPDSERLRPQTPRPRPEAAIDRTSRLRADLRADPDAYTPRAPQPDPVRPRPSEPASYRFRTPGSGDRTPGSGEPLKSRAFSSEASKPYPLNEPAERPRPRPDTLSDPFRLPQPQQMQEPLPPAEPDRDPGSSGSTGPRRAWGV